MTELEFLKHFNKHIRVILKTGVVIEGYCSSFCRSNDDPNGKANITVDTADGYTVVNYEEVEEITTITPQLH